MDNNMVSAISCTFTGTTISDFFRTSIKRVVSGVTIGTKDQVVTREFHIGV
jgi:hypothetical protein